MATQNAFVTDPEIQKRKWWILTSIGLFTFMSTLDGSIVNIALPSMSRELNVPMNQSEWVVSIYLVVICCLLPLFGKLGDTYGKIGVFRIGTILFVCGSILAGFNTGLPFLLFARVVQATGASMTLSANAGIITEVFPHNERGKALGYIGSFVSLGSIAGPGLGGLLLAHLSWSYIFWINIPVGVIAILVGKAILPKDITKTRTKIDYLGFTFYALTIATFFIGIFIGQEIGFNQPAIVGLFVTALISLIVFITIENKIEIPLIQFTIFKNIKFSIGLIGALLIFISNFFFNVISPFYLQNTLGLTPNIAGYILMLWPLVMVVMSPVAGSLSDRFNPQLVTLIGLIILSISQFGFFMINADTPLYVFAIFVAIAGLGNPLFQSPNNMTIMGAVDQKQLGVAGSMNSLSRSLGMVIGVSVATTSLFTAMSHKYGQTTTTYIKNRPDVFLYGMHVTFLISFIICLIVTALTAILLVRSYQEKKAN